MCAYRYLRGNKSESGPQNVLCVDTETCRVSVDGKRDVYQLIFRCGVSQFARRRSTKYNRSEPVYFTQRETFWDQVERLASKRQVLWVFAHNIGFDSISLGFWQLLDCGRFVRRWPRDHSKGSKTGARQSEFQSGLLVTSDPPTIVECWARNGGKIRLVDTLNYFSASLAEIGRWVGLEKLPIPDPWDPDSDWQRYCIRDTEILTEAVLKYVSWVSENQLGMFALTLPSQAMHGYRHTRAAKSIVIHDNLEAQKLESEAYRGGEVYVGRIGPIHTGPGTGQLALGDERPVNPNGYTRAVHHLDANSLFPAAMASGLYPRVLLEYHNPPVASKRIVQNVGRDCIAECLICSDTIPVFTRRAGRSGRFSGLFVATLVGPELAYALSQGIVVAVRRWARYELADLFSDWSNRWWLARWDAKCAGREFDSILCKKIMNSLYGKFAQKAYEWEDAPGVTPPDRWGAWINLDLANREITHYRAIAGTAQRKAHVGYHKDACVAIAAFVTSYAREHMRRLRDVAGNKEVYYQGIDSLYVSDNGLSNLQASGNVSDSELGKMRLVESTNMAEFFGWGLYKFGTRYVRTSIGRGAIECTPGEFEQTNFQRLSAYISQEPADGVEIKQVLKTVQAASPVGIIDKDGWVSPLPAVWGDNPAETTDPREYYDGTLRDWS